MSQQQKAPLPVGARIAYMPDGYSLVPAVVVAIERTNSGSWRGDIRTQDGLLENRSLNPEYFIRQQHLQQVNRTAWANIWDELAAEGK
ncbi:hypothetical protein EV284_3507 [Streptomyces sp. BK022]|uniref:hypothetical protein n=1 Tax=Streptomyces sp. BK022 TaxID=2512123 RepID=UPI0010298939|nr:hypothetical protein [Streptomyces sp. BK022]RZU36024.1 hypothetical protein EV284_3507 [Streptomyces sp. BK022]